MADVQISDVPPTQSQQVAWYDVLGKWNAAVSDFNAQYSALQNLASVASLDPTLQASYQKIMADAVSVQNKISDLNGAITDVKNWLAGAWQDISGAWNFVASKVTSLFGVVMPGMGPGMRGLGQVQLVPIAVIVAAAAWVANKAMGLYQMHTQLAAVQSYVAKGYSPTQAAAAVAQAANAGGLFSGLSSTVKWAAVLALIGLGGWWYFTHQEEG